MIYNVTWKDTLFQAGWVFKLPRGDSEVLFSKIGLQSIPHNLDSPGSYEQLFNLLPRNFPALWGELCGDKEKNKFFLLDFPENIWEIPWELLIKILSEEENQITTSIVRCSGRIAKISNPSILDEKLRTVIIKGANSAKGLDEINLDGEIDVLLKSWENLGIGVRSAIEKPKIYDARKESLQQVLRDNQPHILWFTGHAVARKTVSLLFADGEWITADSFTKFVKESGSTPLYIVFSACESAKRTKISIWENLFHRKRDTHYVPELFKSIQNNNLEIISIVAMQSRIAEKSASILVEKLFNNFVLNKPLELAVSDYRSYLLENEIVGTNQFDWANPVIWSSSIPNEKLIWGTPSRKLAQLQILGRYTLDEINHQPAILDAPIFQYEIEIAREWSKLENVWVAQDPKSAQYRYEITRILKAIQISDNVSVIAIEFENNNEPGLSLQKWADELHNRLRPGDELDENYCRIIYTISKSPVEGWRELCSQNNVCICIFNPPTENDQNQWFWKPLIAAQHNKKAIVVNPWITADYSPDGNVKDKQYEIRWHVKTIGINLDIETIHKSIQASPRLARALAVLGIPIPMQYIRFDLELPKMEINFNDWQQSSTIMISTPAGPMMMEQVRLEILKTISNDELEIAHLDCLQILGNKVLRDQYPRKIFLIEQRLRHILELYRLSKGPQKQDEYGNAAKIEAISLLELYRNKNMPYRVKDLMLSMGNLALDLVEPHAKLIVAWAFLNLGQLAYSKFLLDRVPEQTNDPKDLAWKHGLLAEFYKSDGQYFSKDNARREIELAITICKKHESQNQPNIDSQRRTLVYRQDRARLLQFLLDDRPQARSEYELLVRDLNALCEIDPRIEIDLAIVERNFAECLLSLSTQPNDTLWAKADELLKHAESIGREHPLSPVLSEILYEKARMNGSINPREAEGNLRECIKAANISRHYMVSAIAENRLFWKYQYSKDTFSLELWNTIEKKLIVFPNHGWAVRTLLISRLKAAHVFEYLGQGNLAIEQLRSNLLDLKANPQFNQGSDRYRIVATFAGLANLSSPTYWTDFIDQYFWAKEWLKDNAYVSFLEVWQKGGQ